MPTADNARSTDNNDEYKRLIDFLELLAGGNADIGHWNQAVMCRYQDPVTERARRKLADLGLAIGQCSAIPFPPALQLQAKQLRDELLAERSL